MFTPIRTVSRAAVRAACALVVGALVLAACGDADFDQVPDRQTPVPAAQAGQVPSALPPWRLDNPYDFEPADDGRLISPRLAIIVLQERNDDFDQTVNDLADRYDGQVVGAEPGLGIAQIEFARDPDPLLVDLLDQLNAEPAVQTAGLSTASAGLADQASTPTDWDDKMWDELDPEWPFALSGVTELWAGGLTTAPDVGVLIADFGIFDDHPDLAFAEPVISQFDDGIVARLDDDLDGRNGSQFSHGSHVAGTACGLANGAGIVGVARGCELYGLDLLIDLDVDTTSALVLTTGTTFAVLMDRIVGQHSSIRVVNMSWGLGPHPANDCQFSAEPVDVAILNRVFGDHPNVLWVASAGNCAMNIDLVASEEDITSNAVPFPASAASLQPNVVAVTSINQDLTLAAGANAGPGIGVGAPGGVSANQGRIWGATQACTVSRCIGTYAQYSGTSMAAAHVTGLAALLFQANDALGADVIAGCLTNDSGTQVTSNNPRLDTSRFGAADARQSLECAARASAALEEETAE